MCDFNKFSLWISDVLNYKVSLEWHKISDEEVIEKYGTKKQEIMREALDVYAKELAKHGSSRAKLSFEEYLDTHHL